MDEENGRKPQISFVYAIAEKSEEQTKGIIKHKRDTD
jgi:hypothetical protein